MMKFLAKFGKLDRRIVFGLLLATILIPLLFSVKSRFYVDSATQKVFDYVDKIEPNGRPLMISFDYDPQVAAELDPMARAVLRHCFARNVKVVGLSLAPQGDAIGEGIMTQVAREFNKKHGVDYSYFGYRPGMTIIMLQMGVNVSKALPLDYYQAPYDSLPMMANIHNYDDIALILSLAGSTYPVSWMIYAGTKFKVKIAAGQTAVMAPDNYPFLQTGQFVGQLGGMKGGAEYEQLIVDAGYYGKPDVASKAMNAIAYSHLLIILLIVLGNVGYFISRKLDKSKQS
ncbi:MAG: hypothetical protein Q7U71_08275 [bacterium]|nr:hypothetical protein [bacterium]